MSNANSSISAILVESDGSITLAGSGGMVFLNADGTLNTGRGDGDGSGGRTGHVLNSNIGFVTGLTDAGTYYFDAGSPDYWSEYPSDGSGFIITSMGDSSHSYLTSVDFNGQFNAGFGGDADTGYGAIVVGADPYTWSAANLHRPTVVATPWETDDNLIVTAAFDAVSGTWGLNQYDLDGYYQHTFDTGLTSMEALLQRSDGTLVAVGYDAEGQGQLLTISLTGTGGSETVPYYCTLASETALPGESDGGVFLSQIVLDASGQVINAGGYDNTIWGFNPTATATRVWVQQDANWNVTSIEDSSGNVLERYDYTPYGQRTVLDASGAEKAGGSDYNWVYNFQGMRYDSLSKTNEAENRFETLDGRWLTKDPSQNIYIDGMNPYQGFESNPISNTDYQGLWSVPGWSYVSSAVSAGATVVGSIASATGRGIAAAAVATKDAAVYAGDYAAALPQAYVETAVSGEQADSALGFAENFYNNGKSPWLPSIDTGPAYGNQQAYSQGQAVGFVAAKVEELIASAYAFYELPGAMAGLMTKLAPYAAEMSASAGGVIAMVESLVSPGAAVAAADAAVGGGIAGYAAKQLADLYNFAKSGGGGGGTNATPGKPKYTNPGTHDPCSPNYVKGKTPLPSDAEQVYKNAVPDPNKAGKYWGKNTTGQYYRYDGSPLHYTGTFEGNTGEVPSAVRKALKQ